MKMTALWWWIDRWRKSSAFMDMTLEQQGAYRNLLDEANLRGGPLPNDERVLAKACGDAKAWRRVRAVVLARFQLKPDGWHNDTLDAVLAQSARRALNQANYRDRLDNGGDNGTDNKPANKATNKPDSPSPSPDLITGPGSRSGSGSDDQSRQPGGTTIPRAHKTALAGDDRFARFWAIYPNKKGKDAAWKAWQKRHPSEALTELILAAVDRQKAWPTWTKDRGQFIPHPATWLNQGRWDDEPTVAAVSLVSDIGRQNAANGELALQMMEDRDAAQR